MTYDFLQLSSLDFEALVRDLIQEEIKERFELFKPGPDQGIDARSISKNKKTIVQCKHYVRSGISTLLTKLKSEEADKVKILNPDRYILATSVPLSPSDKTKIKEIFSPFIKVDSDIWGQEDINNLLAKHPEIEKRHFKLWLSSTVILERVLKNAVLTQSEQLVSRVQKKIPIFVQNKSFSQALKILNSSKFVIISGDPGIGKTTLGEMLIYYYMADGFRPIEIKSHQDAYEIHNPEQKTIYYFDDFLGMTYLGDQFSHNTPARIVELIELVKESKNARLVLTSREYVIKQALQQNERFSNGSFLHAKYILELSAYTKKIKANILYNHLYFSDLPNKFLDQIVAAKTYKKIIDHQNYSPRLIEWLTKANFVATIKEDNYPDFFMDTLNNPKKLWEHPFKQISQSARNLLLVTLSLGPSINSQALESAFNYYHSFICKKYSYRLSPSDYMDALNELLGGFLKIERTSISFFNPSVKDFLEYLILENRTILIDIISGSFLLRQCAQMWRLIEKTPNDNAMNTFLIHHQEEVVSSVLRLRDSRSVVVRETMQGMIKYSNDLSTVERILYFCSILERTSDINIKNLINDVLLKALSEDTHLECDMLEWIEVSRHIKRLIEKKILEKESFNITQKILECSINTAYSIEHYQALAEAIDDDILSESHIEKCQESLMDFLSGQARSEIDDENNTSSLKDYLERYNFVANYFGVDGDDCLRYIRSRLHSIYKREEEYADHQSDMWREGHYIARDQNKLEDKLIDDMFQDLRGR